MKFLNALNIDDLDSWFPGAGMGTMPLLSDGAF
jgi:hypothetical protein